MKAQFCNVNVTSKRDEGKKPEGTKYGPYHGAEYVQKNHQLDLPVNILQARHMQVKGPNVLLNQTDQRNRNEKEPYTPQMSRFPTTTAGHLSITK
jgi:hypothetical protein